jgi:hypothetical protein
MDLSDEQPCTKCGRYEKLVGTGKLQCARLEMVGFRWKH